jgi:putative ABC transport system permease protein
VTGLRLAVRNLGRSRFRTSMTVLGVAVAIIAFVLLRTVLAAWEVGVDYAAKDRIATRHKVSFVFSLPKHYIDIIRATSGVQSASWASWIGSKDPREPDMFFASFAVDPESFFEVVPEVLVGEEARRAFRENRKAAIVGDALAAKMGYKVGDRVTLVSAIYPGDWQHEIVGIYSVGRGSFDRSSFILNWNYYNDGVSQSRKDQIGWVWIRIADAKQGAAIGVAIDRAFEDRDVQTLTMSELEMNKSFLGMFSAMLKAIDVVSIVILGIMMLILGNTIAMGVRERTHEYGVLRALGFLPGHVARLVLAESIAVGVGGGALGLAIAYPFINRLVGVWVETNMGSYIPFFRILPATAVAAMVLAVVLAGTAAALPAYRASRLRVTDALRRVE